MTARSPASLALLAACLAGGCASVPRLVARLGEGPPPAEKLRIADRLGASRDPQAAGPLIGFLADGDYVLPARAGAPGEFGAHVEHVSGRANRALLRLTGLDFGFSPFETAEARERAARAWREWHASVEGRLRYDAHAGRLVAEPLPAPAPERSGEGAKP